MSLLETGRSPLLFHVVQRTKANMSLYSSRHIYSLNKKKKNVKTMLTWNRLKIYLLCIFFFIYIFLGLVCLIWISRFKKKKKETWRMILNKHGFATGRFLSDFLVPYYIISSLTYTCVGQTRVRFGVGLLFEFPSINSWSCCKLSCWCSTNLSSTWCHFWMASLPLQTSFRAEDKQYSRGVDTNEVLFFFSGVSL